MNTLPIEYYILKSFLLGFIARHSSGLYELNFGAIDDPNAKEFHSHNSIHHANVGTSVVLLKLEAYTAPNTIPRLIDRNRIATIQMVFDKKGYWSITVRSGDEILDTRYGEDYKEAFFQFSNQFNVVADRIMTAAKV